MGTPFGRATGEQELVSQVTGQLVNDPDLVAQLHGVSDRDVSVLALHHTLGRNPRQASPGDHVHDGTTSPTIDPLTGLDRPSSGQGVLLVGSSTADWTELPTTAGDYVHGTGTGLATGPPPGCAPVRAVRTAADGNLNIASPGTPACDGVTINVAGDRLLLTAQTAPAENGIYVWTAGASPLTRATDVDLAATLRGGILIPVLSGTLHAGGIWRHTTVTNPIVLGTTALTFTVNPYPGQELGYAEITAASAAFTAIADIAGLSVTFTLTSTRKVLLIFSGLVRSSIASDLIEISITDSSNVVQATTANVFIAAVNSNHRARADARKALAAGTYTFKIRGTRNAGTGTCIVNGVATNPAFIQVIDGGV